jgi:hypothetical protein
MPTENTNRIEIRLTDRRPVSINMDEWPVIGHATGDDCQIIDPARRNQALEHGEADEYEITVRRHADGRHLIYATITRSVLKAADHDPDAHTYSGELMDAEDTELEAAIQHQAGMLGIPASVSDDCISSLPAEEL